MAVVVYPIDAVAASPLYTARMAREALSALMAGASAARPLGARSGVRPGTSLTTVTATSTTWTVAPHAGVLDVQVATEAGPYMYAVNANVTGSVTAAHATLPRVDIVYVRLDDPAEADGTSVPVVAAGYLAGVAAASPVAPAAPARCMVLAEVNVPLSGGGSPSVTWVAPYAVAAGVLDPAVSLKRVASSGPASFSPVVDGIVSAPPVTGDGIKKFKVTATCYGIQGTVVTDVFEVLLKDSTTATTLTRHRRGVQSNGGALWTDGWSITATDVPAAGSHVYAMSVQRPVGTGNGTVWADAATPIEIVVEQIA